MKYKFLWKDGLQEIVKGRNIAEAFTAAGYGNGALSALDRFERAPRNATIGRINTKEISNDEKTSSDTLESLHNAK